MNLTERASPDVHASASGIRWAATRQSLDVLVEQMPFYLEDSPILVRDIEAVVEVHDGKKLQLSAHRLRGLSAGLDAQALVDIAGKLDEMGYAGSFEDTALERRSLRPAWERTCIALKAYIQKTRAVLD